MRLWGLHDAILTPIRAGGGAPSRIFVLGPGRGRPPASAADRRCRAARGRRLRVGSNAGRGGDRAPLPGGRVLLRRRPPGRSRPPRPARGGSPALLRPAGDGEGPDRDAAGRPGLARLVPGGRRTHLGRARPQGGRLLRGRTRPRPPARARRHAAARPEPLPRRHAGLPRGGARRDGGARRRRPGTAARRGARTRPSRGHLPAAVHGRAARALSHLPLPAGRRRRRRAANRRWPTSTRWRRRQFENWRSTLVS